MKGAQPTLAQLFLTFLKIGATAFGGNVALVAAVRNEICDRRGWLKEEMLLDATTIGNLLPGALAVNVTSALGYRIHGLAGALLSMAGVLLPSFVLVCVLSALYFRFGNNENITLLFNSLLPAVAAVIAATVWQLFRKNVTTLTQGIVALLAAVTLFFSKSFIATIVVIALGAAAGILFMKKSSEAIQKPQTARSRGPVLFAATLLVAGLIIWLIQPQGIAAVVKQLTLTFGSISVTLFGGGYVFVPVIRDVVVNQMHWVTEREFFDGIALGQVTPGPIMISAAFIGWKQAGIWGALGGTAGTFLPPAALMLIATQFTDRLRGNALVEAIFRGVRPAVIGMIAASVVYIARSGPLNWQAALIFAVVLWLSLKTKISQALLVPGGGLLGWLLYTVFG
jgi:chromate transporter